MFSYTLPAFPHAQGKKLTLQLKGLSEFMTYHSSNNSLLIDDPEPGEYTIEAVLIDASGQTSSSFFKITVIDLDLFDKLQPKEPEQKSLFEQLSS
jgi:hypothetical protein